MYYRGVRKTDFINSGLNSWLKNGEISPEMGRGLKAFVYTDDLKSGGDLIRGFNNYTETKENAESPVSDGKGGYVPSGENPMPPEGEKSRLDGLNYDGVYSREMKLMHELYGKINSFLYPIAVEIINNAEYPGSTVYDYGLPPKEGNSGTIRDFEISREALNQMVGAVCKKAAEMSDDIDEILNDDNSLTAGAEREALLKAAAESLILTELFLSRRPFYRKTAEAYRFFNGRYDGVNPLF